MIKHLGVVVEVVAAVELGVEAGVLEVAAAVGGGGSPPATGLHLLELFRNNRRLVIRFIEFLVWGCRHRGVWRLHG
jgi:hypothetical protein